MAITSTSTLSIDTQIHLHVDTHTISKPKKFTCNSCKKCPKQSLLAIFLG